MLAQKPAALQLCEELGLGAAHHPVPAAAIGIHPARRTPETDSVAVGARHPAVAGAALLGYGLLPPLARARLALEPLVPRARDLTADESVASFFARRFGPATVPLIAAPLLGGIHAGRIDALSMHSLFPTFVDAEQRHGSVWRAFRRRNSGAPAGGAFRSLSSGMGELVSAIGRRLPPGRVRLAAAAETLTPTADGWRIATAQGDLAARAVILAAPAYAAATAVRPVRRGSFRHCAATSRTCPRSASRLPIRASTSAIPLLGSGFVVSRRGPVRRVTACTWVSSKWAGRAPQGTVLLRAFLGGATDAAAVDLSDDELVRVASGELSGVLGLSGDPGLARIHRWRDAGAQHVVGHLARMARLEARLALHPGLVVAGSGFRAIGIPDCVADGRAAAAAVAAFVSQLPRLGTTG